MSELRVGIGVDAHALEEGVPLVLGGVEIAHPEGLAGHSDGDVLAHALIDAMLGSGRARRHRRSSSRRGDERLLGISSLSLLTDAYAQVKAAGFSLVNADCVLVGEEPPDRVPSGRDIAVASRRRSAWGGERPGDDDRRPRLHRPRRGLAAHAVALLERAEVEGDAGFRAPVAGNNFHGCHVDWPSWGNTLDQNRHSPLTEITPSNVDQLGRPCSSST